MFFRKGQSKTSTKQTPSCSIKVDLPEEVSSIRYPITNTWLMAESLKILVVSFSIAGLLLLLAFGQIPQIFTGNSPVFLVLGFIATASGLAFYHIFTISQWKINFEYNFTRMGVTYKIKKGEVTIPYHLIKTVSIHHGVIGRVFGYSVLWINYPNYEQHQAFSLRDDLDKQNPLAPSLSIAGLKKEDAEQIERLFYQIIFPSVAKQGFPKRSQ